MCEFWKPYLETLAQFGIRLMQCIIWEKGYPGLGDFTYNWGQGHEFIWYLKKGNRPVPYRRSGVLHVDKVRPGTNIHPTEKPQGLLNMLIDYSTIAGQFVFDPYAGSGSTVMAAANMGRDALGIELEAGYVEARSRSTALARSVLVVGCQTWPKNPASSSRSSSSPAPSIRSPRTTTWKRSGSSRTRPWRPT